jgi:SOS-response transcriptional repressor LexA
MKQGWGVYILKIMKRDECIGKVMTERQREIYLVIEEWWKKFGFGPSIDDIMTITGDKSRANVHRMIKRLCESGACKRVPNRDRSVRPSWIRFRDL